MIMFVRRSNLSATAPASGHSTRAGSSELSHTPLTAYTPPLFPPMSPARDDSAIRASQSPRLDSVSATHSRRNDLIASTPALRTPKGDRKFTALGYRPFRRWAADSVNLSRRDGKIVTERTSSSLQPFAASRNLGSPNSLVAHANARRAGQPRPGPAPTRSVSVGRCLLRPAAARRPGPCPAALRRTSGRACARPALRRWRRGAPLGEQLDGALRRDRLDRVALAQRGVRLTVGHVGPEPALAQHDRLAGGRILAQLPQRRRRSGPRGPAPWLRLRQQCRRLVQRDREHLL